MKPVFRKSDFEAPNALHSRWQMPPWLALLAVINALLGALIATYNYPFSAPTTPMATTFYGLALVGQFLLLSVACSFIPYFVSMATRNQRLTRATATLVFGLGLALVITDAKVYELYRFHLNAMVLNLVFGGALQDNLSFSAKQWALIGGIVGGLFLLQHALAVLTAAVPRLARPFTFKRVAAVSLSLFLGANVLNAWQDALGNTSVKAQVRYIPWFYPLTMNSMLRKMGVEVVASEKKSGMEISPQSVLNYPKAALTCQNTSAYNVVVLMVDSLRFDMLTPEVMPTLSEFSKQTLYFQKHYSTGSATRFGVFGFFYGIPPSYWHSVLAEEKGSVLFDVLKQQLYQFDIFASAPLNSPEFDQTVFSAIRKEIQWAPKAFSYAERDEWVTEQTLSALHKIDGTRPRFIYAFYDALHALGLPKGFVTPFTPMAEDVNYLGLGPNSDRTPLFNRYKSAALFSDQQLKRVLDKLQTGNLLDNTIVIITSDHGQEFNDLGKNYWGHNSNYGDYQLRVPMLVHWPKKGNGTETRLTSHEDVVPTLMKHALGCQNAFADYSTGTDLFAPQDGRALSAESWSDRAILYRDRIYRYGSYGGAEVLDRAYNPVPQETPDAHIVKEVLTRMTTFSR